MKLTISILSLLIAVFALQCADRHTEGSMEFTVTTKTTQEVFSPAHVLAIWITDAEGNFVKTLSVQGSIYKVHLQTWIANSQQNEVDAVTAATNQQHQIHTVTWDCRDTTGTVVVDGDYRIRVEFTEKNGQGPVTPADYIQFEKGDKPVTLKPEDLAYFYNMELRYTP